MQQGEADIRETIRGRHREAFSFAERLLDDSLDLHAKLCVKIVAPSRERAKAVAVGLWTKICKQFRSILVLCELGLTEDADIIARSLFEATLQMLFVTKKNVNRRRGWKSAPKPPRGSYSMEFRAELYLARTILDDRKRLNVWKQTPGCRRIARKLERPVNELVRASESDIGRVWMRWLCEESQGAFQVETMAWNLGLERWYAAVYRPQSSIAHAADATRYVEASDEPGMLDVRLAADVAGAAGAIRLAIALVGRAMEAMNGRFALEFDQTIRDMDEEWGRILGR